MLQLPFFFGSCQMLSDNRSYAEIKLVNILLIRTPGAGWTIDRLNVTAEALAAQQHNLRYIKHRRRTSQF
jgi:hypothetical protein